MPGKNSFIAVLTAAVGIAGSLSLLEAQTSVTLSTAVSPSTGQAGVTSVSVTGSNFPSGTIAPADVIVTLEPAAAGTGPTVTMPASNVATIVGTSRRITFQIPDAVDISAPTSYRISIAGHTTTATAFASTNKAPLTVTPAARIVGVVPGSVAQGATANVAITGVFTSFSQGSTTASFGPGVSVGGAAPGAFGPVTVDGPTGATAQIVVSSN